MELLVGRCRVSDKPDKPAAQLSRGLKEGKEGLCPLEIDLFDMLVLVAIFIFFAHSSCERVNSSCASQRRKQEIFINQQEIMICQQYT